MDNILTICQEVADLAAVQKPNDLFDDNNQNDRIFKSMAIDTLEELMRYGDWQELTSEAQIYTVCGVSSYRIEEVASNFYCILNNTIYIKDHQDKVVGSITPQQWAKEKMYNCPSLDIKLKIQNNCIKFLKAPPGNLKIVFTYRSNTICWDENTYEEKSKITKNSDIPIFDKYLVKLGITWRCFCRNGLDYAETYNQYQRELKKRFGTGAATEDINLAGVDECNGLTSGVIVYAENECQSCG